MPPRPRMVDCGRVAASGKFVGVSSCKVSAYLYYSRKFAKRPRASRHLRDICETFEGETRNDPVEKSHTRDGLRCRAFVYGDAIVQPDDAEGGHAFGPQDCRSDLDHGLHRSRSRLHDLRHAAGAGRKGRDQAADAGEVRRLCRRQDLYADVARRAALARRQAGGCRTIASRRSSAGARAMRWVRR